MSKIGVSLKIDVSKIDKARLFKGHKGIYLNATAFIDLDELNEYGDSGMITQDVTKEEKQSGAKGPILGNTTVFWKGEGKQQSQSDPHQSRADRQDSQQFDDDIPF